MNPEPGIEERGSSEANKFRGLKKIDRFLILSPIEVVEFILKNEFFGLELPFFWHFLFLGTRGEGALKLYRPLVVYKNFLDDPPCLV